MEVRVTLKVGLDPSELTEFKNEVRFLLADVLAEWARTRGNPREYVEQFYPGRVSQLNKEEMIRRTARNVDWTEYLKYAALNCDVEEE